MARIFRTLICWMLALGAPAYAQQPIDTPTVTEAVERLTPGQFIWAPEIAPAGPVSLIVSLPAQRAVLYRNGVPIAISTVSTGRPGYETPVGVFTVLEKDVEHYSSLYDDAPMPFMQRLTWGGVALHGGQLPGYPASHGCIRLPLEFARLLYGVTHLGMTVIVTSDPVLPRIAPGDPGLPAEGEHWYPGNAPFGPISIVVSEADGRMIVLRNGRTIGSAPVSIKRPLRGVAAYVFGTDRGAAGWYGVALPGQSISPAPATDLGEQVEMSVTFRSVVAEILVPGSILIVTPDTLRTGR